MSEYCLKNINFKVNDGEFVKIERPSGNSSSKLMYLFASLNVKADNEYVFFDYSHGKDRNEEISEIKNPDVSFILKNNYLLDELTVSENIEFPLIYQKLNSQERKTRVNKVLKKFNLFSEKEFTPLQLSKYKQQLISIARSVITNPKLIIADDPCVNLNQNQSNKIIKLLTNLNKKGITILLATSSENLIDVDGKAITLIDRSITSKNSELAVN